VLRARLEPGRVDTAIEMAIARYRQRGVPMAWWTGPVTRPADLGERLLAHGLTPEEGLTGMAVDLLTIREDLPTPHDLTIERVGDMETLKAWSRVLAAGFGVPDFVGEAFLDWFTSLGVEAHLPWRFYLGKLDGEPVATAAMFLSAGVAGIYDVATLPEARRQGVGAAITLAPLREAWALGYRVGILHASEIGLGVYQKIGFRAYCPIGQYVWTGETHQRQATTTAASRLYPHQAASCVG
jgi:GNAT superfamily N-acetyltransferase